MRFRGGGLESKKRKGSLAGEPGLGDLVTARLFHISLDLSCKMFEGR